MKNLLFILITISTMTATAAKPAPKKLTPAEKICNKIEVQYNNICAHNLCDDQVADGTFESFNACVRAEDFAEAAQEMCDGVASLDDLLEKYNQTHNSELECGW